MWLQSNSDLPNRSGIVETASVRKEFRKGYAMLRKTHPDQIENVRDEIAGYVRLLKRAGLQDAQVGASYPHGALFRTLMRALGAWAVRLPVTVLGVLFNGIPFYILLWISRRQDLDKRATWSVFVGLFLFPGFWLMAAVFIGLIIGLKYGVPLAIVSAAVALIAAPATGLVAMKSREIRKSGMQNLRAWYLLRIFNDSGPNLIDMRKSLLAHLSELWETDFSARK